MNFVADGMCFACGPNNPVGLRLTFRRDGDEYVTMFTPDPAHQGYGGVVHGGLVATVLDEVMARLVWEADGPAATARLEIRYRKPMPTATPIEVRGRIVSQRGRRYETSAVARLADGTVLAEATGTFMRMPDVPR